ncbi:MAG: hypothetical protein CVU89_02590 [Firmicutes bacterium HGW-Firmicutes-14]|nr:MAG: hypothetical protein CVU89_02590 [Firmicutes bacterium HGW-Firmicutes-14]
MGRIDRGIRFVWAITAVLVVVLTGCGNTENYEKLTADILGDTRLIALKPITGEAAVKTLVSVKADGDNLAFVDLAEAYGFEVSPGGQEIAYVADDGIYLVNAAGGEGRKLTGMSPRFDMFAEQKTLIGKTMAWSADGKQLAFVCGGDLYVVPLEGDGRPQPVAKTDPDIIKIADGAPAMAPKIRGITCPNWIDNGTLVYQDYYAKFDGQLTDHYNIMQVNTDGSDRKVLVAGGKEPLVSPDGTRLLFHMETNLGGDIMTAKIDGTGARVLTGLLDADRETMPYSWSFDGTYVLFDGFAADPGTGKHKAFSGRPGPDSQGIDRGIATGLPSCSPDGKWIIYPAAGGPKLVRTGDGGFAYDTSKAFAPLKGLSSICWVKG